MKTFETKIEKDFILTVLEWWIFPTAFDFSHLLCQFIGLHLSCVSPRVQWSNSNNDKRWGFQTATRQATNSACHPRLNILTGQELTGITRKIAR